jgi:hypothetical protein
MASAEQANLILVSHYEMLDRTGFDISPVNGRVEAAKEALRPALKSLHAENTSILFSPFQSLSIGDIARVFPPRITSQGGGAGSEPLSLFDLIAGDQPNTQQVGRDDRSHLFVAPRLVRGAAIPGAASAPLKSELSTLLGKYGTPHRAAAVFAKAHERDTQTVFYPLVTHLFQVMGFRSDYSRAGVNYQRWDACLWIDEFAVPIEIKSPTEEVFLATKAIRQALENKVILLSRGGLPTTRDLTSLVVGYKIPNERGDMSNLIDNVFSAYGLRLGVIDLQSLAYLALRFIAEGVTMDADQLSALCGFIDV